jgi:hypothetical protein
MVDRHGCPDFWLVDNPPKSPCHAPEAEHGKQIVAQAAKNMKHKLIGQLVDGAVDRVIHLGRYQGIHRPGAL